MNTVESPICAVDSVVFELRRLSSLCNMLTRFQGHDDGIDLEDVSGAMGVLRDCLDVQIKALDSIHWKPGGR